MGVEMSRIRVTYARALGSVVTVLFVSISFYIHEFDITLGGFDVAGFRLAMWITAVLVLSGGVVGVAGVRNR